MFFKMVVGLFLPLLGAFVYLKKINLKKKQITIDVENEKKHRAAVVEWISGITGGRHKEYDYLGEILETVGIQLPVKITYSVYNRFVCVSNGKKYTVDMLTCSDASIKVDEDDGNISRRYLLRYVPDGKKTGHMRKQLFGTYIKKNNKLLFSDYSHIGFWTHDLSFLNRGVKLSIFMLEPEIDHNPRGQVLRRNFQQVEDYLLGLNQMDDLSHEFNGTPRIEDVYGDLIRIMELSQEEISRLGICDVGFYYFDENQKGYKAYSKLCIRYGIVNEYTWRVPLKVYSMRSGPGGIYTVNRNGDWSYEKGDHTSIEYIDGGYNTAVHGSKQDSMQFDFRSQIELIEDEVETMRIAKQM